MIKGFSSEFPFGDLWRIEQPRNRSTVLASTIGDKPGIGTAPQGRRGKSIVAIASAEPPVSAFEEGCSNA